MAALNFPSNPVEGDRFPTTGDIGGVYWVFTSSRWISANIPSNIEVKAINGGQLGGFRNQIINGDMRVWQRGTAQSAVGPAYSADRWFVPSSGDYSQSNEGPAGIAQSFSIANGVDGHIYQAVELPGPGLAGPFEVGETWTLSFYVKTAANTQDVYSIVGFSDDIGGTNGVSEYNDNGSTFTATTDWQRVTRTFTISNAPASTNQCLRVLLRCDIRSEVIKYTGVQLEPGPVATPFEHRPIGTELALCQRYFYSYDNGGVNAGLFMTTFMGGSGVRSGFTSIHPQVMRDNPTISNLSVRNNADANGGNSNEKYLVITSSSDNSASNQIPAIYSFNCAAEL